MKAIVKEVSASSRHGKPHLIVTVEVDAPSFVAVDGSPDQDLDYSEIFLLAVPHSETHKGKEVEISLPAPKVKKSPKVAE